MVVRHGFSWIRLRRRTKACAQATQTVQVGTLAGLARGFVNRQLESRRWTAIFWYLLQELFRAISKIPILITLTSLLTFTKARVLRQRLRFHAEPAAPSEANNMERANPFSISFFPARSSALVS